jgi:ATP-dependent Clp protease ATP-binding subunit ClpC
VLSQEEARGLGHNYIGTEHILLGLLRTSDGPAARVLADAGVTLARARAQVTAIAGGGGEPPTGTGEQQIPFTPRAKRVLERALREALDMRHNYIGTEHILLGLIRDREGVATHALGELGADPERLGRALRDSLSAQPRSRDPWPLQRAPLRHFASIPDAVEIDLSEQLRQLLRLAAANAILEQRDQIDAGDLLLALSGDAGTRALLGELGVEEQALRDALARWRAGPGESSA